MKKNPLFMSVILMSFSLLSIIPLFKKGFFATDDGDWMIIRFSAFHQALRDGEFPVRFLGRLNNDFGYPVANFLYPGFMYLAEPFHIIGFDFIESIKIIIALSMLLSCLFTYLWLQKFFDPFSSAIGALFYLYTPYHLYDLYQRGSVGELLALAVLPFILWEIERKSVLWSSLGIGLLLIAHNTLAVLFLVLIIIYILLDSFVTKKRRFSILPFLPVILGMGLASFFWIPALYELQYTVFSNTLISNWREYFATINIIGYSTIAVLLLTVVNFARKKIDVTKHRLTLILFLIGVGSLFIATSLSIWLWTILPVSFVQFPFRFLSVLLICVSFLAAMNISLLKGKGKLIISCLLVGVLVYSAFSFITPKNPEDKGEGYYATNMDTTTVHNEYMPVWVKERPLHIPEQKVEINGKGIVENLVIKSQKITFTAILQEKSIVRINTIYYPGWIITIDNEVTPVSYTNALGVMEIAVPSGKHAVAATFTETPLRLFSDIISLLSFVIIIVLAFIRKKKYV